MCANHRCRLKTFCYRYRALPSPTQGYRVYKPQGLECEGHLDIEPDHILKDDKPKPCNSCFKTKRK